MREVQDESIADFQAVVWNFYRKNERSMPWREDTRPYYVLVSELMLQQTQVERVMPKFTAFVAAFPDVKTLSQASLAEVLQLWNGLGYNRRAKFLWLAAQMIEQDYDGVIPQSLEELPRLPGVGPNTAGAILAYAYNQPVVFVETNVRTVLFHHFFAEHSEQVGDEVLRELAKKVLDKEHPREWHWALMDYGTYLKKTAGGRLKQSKHYKKQAPLAGSMREMRGKILRVLSQYEALDDEVLRQYVVADERYELALDLLLAEHLVTLHGGVWMLPGSHSSSKKV